MTDSDSEIEKLIEKIEQYGTKTFELWKLQILKRSIVLFTSIVSNSGVLFILLFFILFLSISISMVVGEALGKLSYGFLIVSAFYLLLFILSYFFLHKWIKKPLANMIIKKVLNKK